MNLLKLLTHIIDFVNQFIKMQWIQEKRIFILIKTRCSLAIKNYSSKEWKQVKKNAKIDNQSFTVSHPIKNNNIKLVSSTDEKLRETNQRDFDLKNPTGQLSKLLNIKKGYL